MFLPQSLSTLSSCLTIILHQIIPGLKSVEFHSADWCRSRVLTRLVLRFGYGRSEAFLADSMAPGRWSRVRRGGPFPPAGENTQQCGSATSRSSDQVTLPSTLPSCSRSSLGAHTVWYLVISMATVQRFLTCLLCSEPTSRQHTSPRMLTMSTRLALAQPLLWSLVAVVQKASSDRPSEQTWIAPCITHPHRVVVHSWRQPLRILGLIFFKKRKQIQHLIVPLCLGLNTWFLLEGNAICIEEITK